MEFLPRDVLQTHIYPALTLKESGRLGLVNKIWYDEGWQNITHLDLSGDFGNVSADGIRFLSLRPKLLHVASIHVEEERYFIGNNDETSRCVGLLILNCGTTLKRIDVAVKVFDKVLTQKYLTKYGSRLLHLSFRGYDVPLKLLKSVVNHCSNLQSLHVACENQEEIVPLLVEHLTTLKQLILTDVNPSELHPQLASLTSLAKIHLSELPQCVNKWKQMSDFDSAAIDADIEELCAKLPANFDINNVQYWSRSILWHVEKEQFWRHCIRKYGFRIERGSSAWMMNLFSAARIPSAEMLSFLLNLPPSPESKSQSSIMSASGFYELMKTAFSANNDEILQLCLKHAPALATESARREVGLRLIHKFLEAWFSSPHQVRTMIASDKENALCFPQAIADSSKFLFESVLSRWNMVQTDRVIMTKWLIENGMDWRSQLLVANKEFYYAKLTPALVELFQPMSEAPWLQLHSWPRSELYNLLIQCNLSQFERVKQILSPYLRPDGSFQLPDDFAPGLVSRYIQASQPSLKAVGVLRQLGIHPALSPATFACDDVVNKILLTSFLHRLIQHAEPDEQDELADLLLSIQGNYQNEFASSVPAIKSNLKKRKFLKVIEALSRSVV